MEALFADKERELKTPTKHRANRESWIFYLKSS